MISNFQCQSRLQAEFGDIYKYKILGAELVFVNNPEDSKTLLDNDGPIPYMPGFEKIEYIRSTSLKHLFNSEPGLLSQENDVINTRPVLTSTSTRFLL